MPAATPVFAVTTGTVTSVTPEPSGLQVVLTGSDGATYIYGGGQPVIVHWGEQHPDGGAQAVRVHPGEQVMAGQELLEAGWAGFSLKTTVPDVASPVCEQPALGSWAAGTTVDVHALPTVGCGSPATGMATATGQPVVIVADPPSAGMANQMRRQLTAEHLRSQVVTLPSPLAQVPTSQWPAVIDQAVTNANATVAVVAGVYQPAPSPASLAAGIDGVLARLPAGTQVSWARPAPTQPNASTPAPMDPALSAAIAGHTNLRVQTVQPLTVSSGGAPARGTQADQANAGAVVDYLDVAQRWLGASRADWATAFSQRIGASNPAAVQFVMAWTVKEGATVWANNPLNSSAHTSGSSPLAGNPDGVQIYPSVLSGLDADSQTLLGSPMYAAVVAALRSGNVAHAAAALEASPWCVAPGGGQCPGYGAAIQALVTAWQHSPATSLGVGAQPVGSVLTPVSTPAGAPADFGPVWQFLEAQLGKPYLWGGAGPNSWDCSGLVMAAYAQAGVQFVHYAASQYSATANHPVALGDLQPGDLVFWAYDPGDPGSIHHVAVYVGDGMVLDALQTGTPVQIQPLWTDGLFGATNPLA